MRVLLIGNGGREHAMANKISSSALCEQLYTAPGNPGTALCGTNVSLDVTQAFQIGSFIEQNKIGLVVVGPEQPLVDGLYDQLLQGGYLQNCRFFGPGANGARLEGSKSFAKAFMLKHQIPTAAYKAFHANQAQEAIAYLDELDPPFVLKADGLAAGKGVLICSTKKEAQDELMELFGGKFGHASDNVVIEAFLEGIEMSVFALVKDNRYVLLPEAKDYKRIGEEDTGLNTGGMGSVSPLPFYTPALARFVEERIVQPTITGLQNEGIQYTGFVFFGLMVKDEKAQVIEYNVRMGDPETQSVLMRLDGDLLEILLALTDNKPLPPYNFSSQTVVNVVLASQGYPNHYEKGKLIETWENIENAMVFQAGTIKNEKGELLTAGGRVMSACGIGPDLKSALEVAYQQVNKIQYEGKYCRQDIGLDVISKA